MEGVALFTAWGGYPLARDRVYLSIALNSTRDRTKGYPCPLMIILNRPPFLDEKDDGHPSCFCPVLPLRFPA